MRNPDLEMALQTLAQAGGRDVQRSYGGKQIQLRWTTPNGQTRMYSVAATPSDRRSPLNTRSDIRKILRQDGLIADPITPAPARQPSRLDLLERRLAIVEQELRKLKGEKSE